MTAALLCSCRETGSQCETLLGGAMQELEAKKKTNERKKKTARED